MWSWVPSFLNRYHGMTASTAAKYAGVLVLCGAVGAVFWGGVADRLARRRNAYKLMMLVGTTSATAALFIFAFSVPLPPSIQYPLILLGGFMMTCTVGVSVSAVLDVTHPGLRATGSAVHAFAINLFGLAVGPFITGIISDIWSLSTAMSVIPAVGFLSAFFYWRASQTYEGDAAAVAAEHRALST